MVILVLLVVAAAIVGAFWYFKIYNVQVIEEDEEEFFTDSDFDSTSEGQPVTVYLDPRGCRIHPRENLEPQEDTVLS